MDINILGWRRYTQGTKQEHISKENVARVAVENRGGYLLYTESGELEGIVRGTFMRQTKNENQYPKVGDWVEIEKLAGEKKAIIKSILPRISKLSRKRVGEQIEEQIIATNIDLVFIIMGMDGDFNVGRAERYVAMAKEGNCQPVIVLSKADIATDAAEKKKIVQDAFPGLAVFSISAKTGQGLEEISQLIKQEISIVFVGSSGAGKSTLLNVFLGNEDKKTQQVRLDDSRGRHTTTKRELSILASGGILIDTPGMRELGLWASQDAIGETFEDIAIIAQGCKFRDCDHENSAGCAVLEALASGQITKERYASFLKLFSGLEHGSEKKKIKAANVGRRRQQSVIKKPFFEKKK